MTEISRRKLVLGSAAWYANRKLTAFPTAPPQEIQDAYRPLSVLYFDGWGGRGFAERPFYKVCQDKDLRVPWKAILPANPYNPNPQEMIAKTRAELQTVIQKNAAVKIAGYSMGGVEAIFTLAKLCNPTSPPEVFLPHLTDYLADITLYAPADVMRADNAKRQKIKDCPDYQRFFAKNPQSLHPEPALSQAEFAYFKNLFATKTTIVYGKYDTEYNHTDPYDLALGEQGRMLSERLGLDAKQVLEVTANHGMTSLPPEQTGIDPRVDPQNPTTVIGTLFSESVTTYRQQPVLKQR